MYPMFCGVFRENAMVFASKSQLFWSFPFVQYRINVSSGYSRSFSPEIRYFFLKYTKYSCEKLPFSDVKSLAESSPPINAILPLIVCGGRV